MPTGLASPADRQVGGGQAELLFYIRIFGNIQPEKTNFNPSVKQF